MGLGNSDHCIIGGNDHQLGRHLKAVAALAQHMLPQIKVCIHIIYIVPAEAVID
ncbi:hypothetical protein SDC9_209958 [bioreactor metagenome]|uniref:Uncharacterized protein n=1 Tax=bioreactor metagenome TaxID=1076179 RepID=A0A645JF29_9ZZZZ